MTTSWNFHHVKGTVKERESARRFSAAWHCNRHRDRPLSAPFLHLVSSHSSLFGQYCMFALLFVEMAQVLSHYLSTCYSILRVPHPQRRKKVRKTSLLEICLREICASCSCRDSTISFVLSAYHAEDKTFSFTNGQTRLAGADLYNNTRNHYRLFHIRT